MKVCAQQFNLYLAILLAMVISCGCKTTDKDNSKDAVGALRVHIESPKNVADTGETINLMRAAPVALDIATDPILTEANIVAARLIEGPGDAFAVDVKFDEISAYTLEQFTAANPGKHFAIFGQWGKKLVEGRWLAAPLITHRIVNGELVFTPDASLEETKQLVNGLANVARKNVKNTFK